MLNEGWWKPLYFEPFCVGRLEDEEVSSLAWVIGAVHIGVEKNAEVCRELELVQCKDVVAVDGGGIRILQEGAKVIACTREVCWIRRGVEGVLPCAVVM